MGVTFYTKLQLLYLAVLCILIEQTSGVGPANTWGGYNPPPSPSSLNEGLTIVTPPSHSRGTQHDPYATTGGATVPGVSHNEADDWNDETELEYGVDKRLFIPTKSTRQRREVATGASHYGGDNTSDTLVPESKVYHLPSSMRPNSRDFDPKFRLIENEGQREDFNFQHYVDGNVYADWSDVVTEVKIYLHYFRSDPESKKLSTLKFTDEMDENEEISSAEDTNRTEAYPKSGGLIAVCRLTIGHQPIKRVAPHSKYSEGNKDSMIRRIIGDQMHTSNISFTVVQQYVCYTAQVSCIQHVRDEFKHKFYLVNYSQAYLKKSETYWVSTIDWKMYNDAKQQVKAFRGLSAIAMLSRERYLVTPKILEGDNKEFFKDLEEKFIVL